MGELLSRFHGTGVGIRSRVRGRPRRGDGSGTLVRVSLRAGPYTFSHVTYDPPSDVIYAAIDSPASGTRQETPERHVLRFDERGRFSGMILVGPRAQLEREGAVFVSLPTGERVRVQGAERLMSSP